MVVVYGDDLEPAGESKGENSVGADVTRPAGDQYSLDVGGNVSGRRGK